MGSDAVDVPWFHQWLKDNEVGFQRASRNAGGGHLKRPDSDKLGKFHLVPRHDNSVEGKPIVSFEVRFWSWQMKSMWDGLILVPRGEDEPPCIRNLAAWKSGAAWDEDIENEDLAELVADLQTESLPEGKDYKRLESLMSVPGEEGGLAIDIVRLVLLHGATNLGENVALVVFCGVDGDGMESQNGGGSGPPD